MRRYSPAWIVLGVLYGAFFVWYTALGGPLTADESEHYVAVMRERGATADDAAKLRALHGWARAADPLRGR